MVVEDNFFFKKLFSCVILRLYSEFQCHTMPGTCQKVCVVSGWWWVVVGVGGWWWVVVSSGGWVFKAIIVFSLAYIYYIEVISAK